MEDILLNDLPYPADRAGNPAVPATRQEPLHSGQLMPLVITSAEPDGDLVKWIQANRRAFEADLVIHGGVLFRGFNLKTAADFKAFMSCFNTDPLPYLFRSSPRKELSAAIKNIYLSTTYPQDRSINMHNESSYSRVWGQKIVFCCLTPAEKGGETPLADSRRVLKDIDPGLLQKFRETGVKYRRNLFEGIGMPWQEVFQTSDRQQVLEICRKNEINCIFRDEEDAVIEWVKPAIYSHPVSGEEMWFNHALFFNKYARYEELGLGEGDFLPEDYLSSDTFFGDGTAISYEQYQNLRQAYEKNKVIFPYQQGDVVFLDNMLTSHGRNPYSGERVIATAIIEATYDKGFSATSFNS
ncbi:TauD/TfdA family dioxygenase [Chitinophaga sp. G-6-1-13]|uniref:TauD/TfdA family dioxygenase n=1 Tax=Chitinophaga fulva TaxID=2728842 RepID=A0A848GMG6_9BACT|nr:TauD/TfdA family dioxygenase [Chitinophaga fulva]NML37870.1 TauD/TfdA family dioxygenase [Chitinophaga fulva]